MTPSRGDVYTVRRTGMRVVVDTIEKDRITVLHGCPRQAVVNPTSSFQSIFSFVRHAQHRCCVEGCTNVTSLRTLRGEYLCQDHLPYASDFLIDGETTKDAISRLVCKVCPVCKQESPLTSLDVTGLNTVRECYHCENKYILSSMDNPTWSWVLNNCERGIIGSRMSSRFATVPPHITVSNEYESNGFLAINPTINLPPFQRKPVTVANYTPKFVFITKDLPSKIPKYNRLAIPIADFDHFKLDPSQVIAECEGLESPHGDTGYCGEYVIHRNQRNHWYGSSTPSRRVSEEFLQVFRYSNDVFNALFDPVI